MQRTQIYLDRGSTEALRRMARETGKTRSQLIREAIDQFQRQGHDAVGLALALRASAGAWKRRESGAALVEKLRRGRLSRLHR